MKEFVIRQISSRNKKPVSNKIFAKIGLSPQKGKINNIENQVERS